MDVRTLGGTVVCTRGLETRPRSVALLKALLGAPHSTVLNGYQELTDDDLQSANGQHLDLTLLIRSEYPAYDSVHLNEWSVVAPAVQGGSPSGYCSFHVVFQATGRPSEFCLYRDEECSRVVFPIRLPEAIAHRHETPRALDVELSISQAAASFVEAVELKVSSAVCDWVEARSPGRRRPIFNSSLRRDHGYAPRLRTKLTLGAESTQVLVLSGNGAQEEGAGLSFLAKILGAQGGRSCPARAVLTVQGYYANGVCGVLFKQTFFALQTAPLHRRRCQPFQSDGTVALLRTIGE